MDQIALYNNGFHHTLAVMGIALGAPSLERLLSLTKNIYLALDSDDAGLKAMERINRQFAEKGVVAKFLEFSPQKDPDEFIQAQGALAFQAKLDNAVPAFDVFLNKIIPLKLPEVLDRKLEILTSAFELMSPLRSHLAATERVVNIAKRLGLKSEPAQIVKNYEDFLAAIEAKEKMNARFQPKVKVDDSISQDHQDHTDEDYLGMSDLELSELDFQNHVSEMPIVVLSKIERLVVQELVQLPMLFSEENSLELLDFVTSDEVKKYIGKVRKLLLEIDETEYASVISNLTSNSEYSLELREAVSSALFKYKVRELDSKTKKKILHDLKTKLQMDLLKNRKDEIKKLQQVCAADDEMTKLLQELSQVEVSLQALKKAKR
jgi:DNA primase